MFYICLADRPLQIYTTSSNKRFLNSSVYPAAQCVRQKASLEVFLFFSCLFSLVCSLRRFPFSAALCLRSVFYKLWLRIFFPGPFPVCRRIPAFCIHLIFLRDLFLYFIKYNYKKEYICFFYASKFYLCSAVEFFPLFIKLSKTCQTFFPFTSFHGFYIRCSIPIWLCTRLLLFLYFVALAPSPSDCRVCGLRLRLYSPRCLAFPFCCKPPASALQNIFAPSLNFSYSPFSFRFRCFVSPPRRVFSSINGFTVSLSCQAFFA